jgi:hypothetical protein
MKTYKYNLLAIFMLLASVIYAQKHDKKVSENFKVNQDVTVVINANNTDVDIETWNKNEVSVEGYIEVEGVDKEEAKKILKSWNFEALGNKDKVKISSYSGNMFFEFDHNFDFDFEMPEFEFEFQELNLPEIVIPEFEMPEFNFELPEIHIEIPEFDDFDFDYEAYKNDSTYLKKYKLKIAEKVEQFKKSDWKKKMDSVKNTAEYKAQMESFKKEMAKMKVELKKMQESDEFKKSRAEAERVAKEVQSISK